MLKDCTEIYFNKVKQPVSNTTTIDYYLLRVCLSFSGISSLYCALTRELKIDFSRKLLDSSSVYKYLIPRFSSDSIHKISFCQSSVKASAFGL